MTLPTHFVDRTKAALGPAEFEKFEAALAAEPPVSVRLNPRKTSPELLRRFEKMEKIGWADGGFYLPERPVFTLDPTFWAGAFYVQEASSMFVGWALGQVLDFHNSLKIMDLCAAPGGKSTQIAGLLNDSSLLVSNETIRSRVGPLQENLEKWGWPNAAVLSHDPDDLAEPLEGFFDAVVVDAPCSGEGLFRKDENARREWSPENVETCSLRQRRILAAAEKMVAPGGFLVFSTCTFNEKENLENSRFLSQLVDFEPVALAVEKNWGIETVDFGTGCGHQFWPHRLRGEGFFLSLFRKKADEKKTRPTAGGAFQKIKPLEKSLRPEAEKWLERPADFAFFTTPTGEVLALPSALEADFLALDRAAKSKFFGLPMGIFKGKDFVPSHALALSTAVSSKIETVDLSREQALFYLKKEFFALQTDQKGWAAMRFEGQNLGWAKLLPNRLNNYLPVERRIRMQLPAR